MNPNGTETLVCSGSNATTCTDNNAPRALLPGNSGYVNLNASTDRTTDIRVTFNPLNEADGAETTYRVRSVGPGPRFSPFVSGSGWTGPSPIDYRVHVRDGGTLVVTHNFASGVTAWNWVNAPRGSVSVTGPSAVPCPDGGAPCSLTASKGATAHPNHVEVTVSGLSTTVGASRTFVLEGRNAVTPWTELDDAVGNRAVGVPQLRFERWRENSGAPGTFSRISTLRDYATGTTIEDTSADLEGGVVQWYGVRVRAAGAISEIDTNLDFGFLFRPPLGAPVLSFQETGTTLSATNWFWSGGTVDGALSFEERTWPAHGGTPPASWSALSGTSGNFLSNSGAENVCWSAEVRGRNLSGPGPVVLRQGATRLSAPDPTDFTLTSTAGEIVVDADVSGINGRGDGEVCAGLSNQTGMQARAYRCEDYDAGTLPANPTLEFTFFDSSNAADVTLNVGTPGCWRVQVRYGNRIGIPTQWVTLPGDTWTAPVQTPEFVVAAPSHDRLVWGWNNVSGATAFELHQLSGNWSNGFSTLDVEAELPGAIADGLWDRLPTEDNPFAGFVGTSYEQRASDVLENVCMEAAIRGVNEGGAGPTAAARIAAPLRPPAAPRHPAAQVGSALQLTPTAGAAEVPWHGSLNAYEGTVEMWIRPTTWTSGHVALMSRRTATSNGFMIFRLAGSNNLVVDWGGSATRWDTGVELPPLNRWTHLAFAHDGTTMRVFVNGVQRASSVMGNPTAFAEGTSSLWIGRDAIADQYRFQGQMKDIRYWSYARSENEIRQERMTLPTAFAPGLISGWRAHAPDVTLTSYTTQLTSLRSAYQQAESGAARAAILADYMALNQSAARLTDVAGRNHGAVQLRATPEVLVSLWPWTRESIIELQGTGDTDPILALVNAPRNFGSSQTCLGGENDTALQFRLHPCETSLRFPPAVVDTIETDWVSSAAAFPLSVDAGGHHCFDIRHRGRNMDGLETAWSEPVRWTGFDLNPPAEFAQAGGTVTEIFWQFRDRSSSEDGWQLKGSANDTDNPVCFMLSSSRTEEGRLYRCDEAIGTGSTAIHGNLVRSRVARSVIGLPFAASPAYSGSWTQPAVGYTLVRSPSICGQYQEDVDCGRVSDSVWNGAQDFVLTNITCDGNAENCEVGARLRVPRNSPYLARTGAEVYRQEILPDGALGPRVQVTSNQCITTACANTRTVVSHESRGYGNWVADSDPRYWPAAGNAEGAIVDAGVNYGSSYRYAVRYFNANGFPSFTTTFDVLIGCEGVTGGGQGVCAFALPGTQPAAGTTVTRVAGCDIPGDGSERCDSVDWSCSGDPYTEFDGTPAFTPGASCGSCGDGAWACLPDGSGQTCIGSGGSNACGGCSALVGNLGDTCEGASSCFGELVCAPDNESLVCGNVSTAVNACGVSCEPLADEPGEACGTCGLWACDGSGDLFCDEGFAEGAACVVDGLSGACAAGTIVCGGGGPVCESVCEDGCTEERSVAMDITGFASGGVGDVPGFAATIEELHDPAWVQSFDFAEDCDLHDSSAEPCSVVTFSIENLGDDDIPAGTFVSVERLTEVAPGTTGLRAEYFNGDNLQHFVMDRIEPSVNHSWSTPPSGDLVLGDYSARWRGQIRGAENGEYTFRLPENQPARLIVDGVLILDNWDDPDASRREASATLSESDAVDFTLILAYPASGPLNTSLTWSGPGTSGFELVPEGRLSPYAGRVESRRIELPTAVAAGTMANLTLCWQSQAPRYGAELRMVVEDSDAELAAGQTCMGSYRPESLAASTPRQGAHIALCGDEVCDGFDNSMTSQPDDWPETCGDPALECQGTPVDTCGPGNGYACAQPGALCNPLRGYCYRCSAAVLAEEDCNLVGCDGGDVCDKATGLCIPTSSAAASAFAADGEELTALATGSRSDRASVFADEEGSDSAAGGCATAPMGGAGASLLLLLGLVAFTRRRREVVQR